MKVCSSGFKIIEWILKFPNIFDFVVVILYRDLFAEKSNTCIMLQKSINIFIQFHRSNLKIYATYNPYANNIFAEIWAFTFDFSTAQNKQTIRLLSKLIFNIVIWVYTLKWLHYVKCIKLWVNYVIQFCIICFFSPSAERQLLPNKL